MRIPPRNKLSVGSIRLIEEFSVTGNIGSTLFLKTRYNPESNVVMFSIIENPPIIIREIVRIFF